MEPGIAKKKQLLRSAIEEILLMWCSVSDCDWGQAYLLDRAGWDARRRSHLVRGIMLPPADWVLYLGDSGLYNVLNQIDPEGRRHDEFLAYLRQHKLIVNRLTHCYAKLIWLHNMSPR